MNQLPLFILIPGLAALEKNLRIALRPIDMSTRNSIITELRPVLEELADATFFEKGNLAMRLLDIREGMHANKRLWHAVGIQRRGRQNQVLLDGVLTALVVALVKNRGLTKYLLGAIGSPYIQKIDLPPARK
ncbi:MAG TPA: hypothetical protein VNG90_01915 [Candidatus Acidoferrum sp.]|nr:hypothetical protein [Candidatus Acidoferrum sp.]